MTKNKQRATATATTTTVPSKGGLPQHQGRQPWKSTPTSASSSNLASMFVSMSTVFSSCPFPPMMVFAICLLASQLLIFNVGVIMLEGKIHSSENSVVFESPFPSKMEFLSKNYKKRPDGTFNGYPIYFRKDQTDIETTIHCVGENYQDKNSWLKKSCEFKDYFCFDTATNNYVVFDKPENEKLYKHAETSPFTDISQSFLKTTPSKTNSVSLGGINLKWNDEISRLEWFPEIRTVKDDQSLSYYELPPGVVMIPFHSMNAANPGHLVWDDFLPIFTLLGMFQLKNNNDDDQLMLMRYVLKGQKGQTQSQSQSQKEQNDNNDSRGLWASCDWNDKNKEACRKMYIKFLPLMLGLNPIHSEIVTTEQFDFQPSNTNTDGKKPTTLVCSKHAVAGIGALTDHGTSKLHGWQDEDYEVTQNHARGGMIYEFRNFMLRNMGIPVELKHKPPFRVVFSEKSSSIETRDFDFKKQKEFLKQNFHPSYVSVESYVFSEMPLAEQLEISSQASIFITSCGGGAVSSMFMPRGSSVIMYYVEDGGIIGNQRTGKPARLDWDLFNNLAYLKLHWLPSGTMNTNDDIKALTVLIQHELNGLIREKSYDHFFD